MSELSFHRCYLCHAIFSNGRRSSYCARCIPRKERCTGPMLDKIINSEDIEAKRTKWREYWHRRMESPEFREKERLRSLARARANRKYLVKEKE